jgi:AhpC/TSA family
MTAPAFTLVDGDRESTVPASAVDALAAGDRPLAVDREERVAYVGSSAQARAARLASLQAPDFTLPDLDGRPHSLSQHRGKKVLLIAYASW